MGDIITHWERGGSKEASGVYEEVNCESERSNIQLELKKNIAYGDVATVLANQTVLSM